MAVYDHEEQEQLDAVRSWWKEHGSQVSAVLIAAAVGVLGWQYWQRWQAGRTAQASAIYSSIEASAGARDVRRAGEAAGELIDKYSGTAYAPLGALLAARLEFDAGDAKSAARQLAWAADNASQPELRDIARLRLAAVLLDDKSYDEALKRLAAEPLPAFAARFAELRGDVLAAQGKAADAHAAYQQALDKLDAADKANQDAGRQGAQDHARLKAYREMIQVKLDSLGAKQ